MTAVKARPSDTVPCRLGSETVSHPEVIEDSSLLSIGIIDSYLRADQEYYEAELSGTNRRP